MRKREFVCKTCNKPFINIIKRENGYRAQFCSRQCIKPKIKKNCEFCDVIYTVIPYRSKTSRWCSKQCRYSTMRGSSEKDNHIYNRKDWHEARKKALERDKYMCQKCGKTDIESNLHVNHILPYRLVHSHILTNLITLCATCHAEMDWTIRDLLHVHPVRKRFIELIMQMYLINLKKSNDYATSSDPLSNFRRAERLGITPFQGILLRLEDKISRLEELSQKESLVLDESIKDTLIDTATYALLAIQVYEDTLEEIEAKVGLDKKKSSSI